MLSAVSLSSVSSFDGYAPPPLSDAPDFFLDEGPTLFSFVARKERNVLLLYFRCVLVETCVGWRRLNKKRAHSRILALLLGKYPRYPNVEL